MQTSLIQGYREIVQVEGAITKIGSGVGHCAKSLK